LLAVEDVDALAMAIRPHLRALVLVGFWGHLRLGELVGLERADVELDEGTVRVERQVIETDEGPMVAEPKAASRRMVYLPEPGD
jgi:integrase